MKEVIVYVGKRRFSSRKYLQIECKHCHTVRFTRKPARQNIQCRKCGKLFFPKRKNKKDSKPNKECKQILGVAFWIQKLNEIQDYPTRCRCASLLWFSHLSKGVCDLKKNTELHNLILADRNSSVSIDVVVRTLYEIGYDYKGRKVREGVYEKRHSRKQNASTKTREQTD